MLTLAVLAGCARPQPVRDIAVVRTLDDLLAQPAIEVDALSADSPPVSRPPTVRLGIQADTCRVGDGVLLYVLAEGVGPRFHGGMVDLNWPAGQFRVGPVHVAIESPEDRPRDERVAGSYAQQQVANSFDCSLFVLPIQPNAEGRWQISARNSPDGPPIASAAIAVAGTTEPDWLGFGSADMDTEPQARRTGDPKDLAAVDLTIRPAGAVVPHWEYVDPQPLLWTTGLPGALKTKLCPGGQVNLLLSDTPDARPAAADELPTFIPDTPSPGLNLIWDAGALKIDSLRPINLERPDWHFIARWWINGKPVQGKPAEAFGDANGMVIIGRHVRITVHGLGEAIGAKPGDRVAVQLLYCPNGWRFATESMEMLRAAYHGREELPRLPLMTNRVEFVLK